MGDNQARYLSVQFRRVSHFPLRRLYQLNVILIACAVGTSFGAYWPPVNSSSTSGGERVWKSTTPPSTSALQRSERPECKTVGLHLKS